MMTMLCTASSASAASGRATVTVRFSSGAQVDLASFRGQRLNSSGSTDRIEGTYGQPLTGSVTGSDGSSCGATPLGVFTIPSLQPTGNVVTVPSTSLDPPLEPELSADELHIVALVNGMRLSKGLMPLVIDESLTIAASSHLGWMHRTGRFAHCGLLDRSPHWRIREAGFTGAPAFDGHENIARASGSHSYREGDPPRALDTARLFDQWRTSPPHMRAMSAYATRCIGIAVRSVDVVDGRMVRSEMEGVLTFGRAEAAPGSAPCKGTSIGVLSGRDPIRTTAVDQLDTAYGAGGIAPGPGVTRPVLERIVVADQAADGSITIAQHAGASGPLTIQPTLRRLTAAGQRDPTFNEAPFSVVASPTPDTLERTTITAVRARTAGGVLVTGTTQLFMGDIASPTYSSDMFTWAALVDSRGSLVPEFGSRGARSALRPGVHVMDGAARWGAAVQNTAAGERILLAQQVTTDGSAEMADALRIDALRPGGGIDTEFGDAGRVLVPAGEGRRHAYVEHADPVDLVALPDGRVLVGWSDVLPFDELDPARDPQRRIMLQMLDANGQPRQSFGAGSRLEVHRPGEWGGLHHVQHDAQRRIILVASGDATAQQPESDGVQIATVAHVFDEDGRPDASFSPNGMRRLSSPTLPSQRGIVVTAMALQGDRSILIAGAGQGDSRAVLYRYTFDERDAYVDRSYVSGTAHTSTLDTYAQDSIFGRYSGRPAAWIGSDGSARIAASTVDGIAVAAIRPIEPPPAATGGGSDSDSSGIDDAAPPATGGTTGVRVPTSTRPATTGGRRVAIALRMAPSGTLARHGRSVSLLVSCPRRSVPVACRVRISVLLPRRAGRTAARTVSVAPGKRRAIPLGIAPSAARAMRASCRRRCAAAVVMTHATGTTRRTSVALRRR